MNPETQKQPDFNFILSQPGPGDVAPKKKRSPWVWVLAGVIVLGVITVIALMFVAPAKNVQNSAFPVSDTADAYLEHIKANQYDAAYELLGSDAMAVTSLEDYQQMAPLIYENLNIEKCERASKDTATLTPDEVNTVDYVCSVKEGSDQVVVSLEMVKENENIRVNNVSIAPRI